MKKVQSFFKPITSQAQKLAKATSLTVQKAKEALGGREVSWPKGTKSKFTDLSRVKSFRETKAEKVLPEVSKPAIDKKGPDKGIELPELPEFPEENLEAADEGPKTLDERLKILDKRFLPALALCDKKVPGFLEGLEQKDIFNLKKAIMENEKELRSNPSLEDRKKFILQYLKNDKHSALVDALVNELYPKTEPAPKAESVKVTQEKKPSESLKEKPTPPVKATKGEQATPVTQQEAIPTPSNEKSDIPIEIIKGEQDMDIRRSLFNKKFGAAFDKCFKTENTYKHNLTPLDKISLQPLMSYYLSTPFSKAEYKDFILKCLMTSKIEKYKSLRSPLDIKDSETLKNYNTMYGKDVDDFINELLKQ